MSATSTDRILNFSAGPAVMPEPVLDQIREDVWNIDGSGIGVLEHSHRGPVIDRIFDDALERTRRLAGVGDDHEVLFLQGGASMQFGMIPMNFLPEGGIADYPDTGTWTSKAIKEARKFGEVNVAFAGSDCNYDHCPSNEELSLTDGAAYLHYCSNNTIYGTRYATPPSTTAPLVCDTSSEMFARPWPFADHAMVYAGAQKNLGPSGVALVIIRRDFMESAGRETIDMLDYRKHAKAGSRLNTPPVFGVYAMNLVMAWIEEQGGLPAMADHNDAKAGVIYDAIDGSGGFYRGHAKSCCRSTMNVTFRLPSEDLEKAFVEQAGAEGMSGLKGHRSVGGIRASIYNAFPAAGCDTLASFMADFASKNG
ncbi:MAG: 3-phosphoserine/phosphohydroxythreonine transaminase [Phycisphaerae bacterium]|nr:3-phosphoserine/phosphohydroxythreonine transaminase [Phycisphaerae bacterium]